MSADSVNDHVESVSGDGGDDAGEATGTPKGAPPPAAASSGSSNPLDLAVSVTRQVEVTGPSAWKYLVCGMDTLDLGLYVDWGRWWPASNRAMLEGKQAAERTEGIPWERGRVQAAIILPGGKPPMYAFHLQTADFHIFIARREKYGFTPLYPNVYVSLAAKASWLRGVPGTSQVAGQFIKALGGKIDFVNPVALTSGRFYHPRRPSLDFLRAFKSARSSESSQYLNGDKLETFYVGAHGAALQCRIHNKS